MISEVSLGLVLLGLLLALGGTAAITWVGATLRGDHWRRRALAAEREATRLRGRLARRRAPDQTLQLPAADAVDAQAPTVLMGVMTPAAAKSYMELERRYRLGGGQYRVRGG